MLIISYNVCYILAPQEMSVAGVHMSEAVESTMAGLLWQADFKCSLTTLRSLCTVSSKQLELLGHFALHWKENTPDCIFFLPQH